MSPTISSGDMVALQQLEDFRYLISGEIYAIVTKNGLRTIKRVNDKGNDIELVPDNKDYSEQQIPKEELMAVFSVKACVKAY
jgi:SOS-response transcriptional repressor LexA